MRYAVAIILLFICGPSMAKHRHKHHHRSSHHHSVAHRSHHSRHHSAVVQHSKPKVLTEEDILSQQFEAQKGNLRLPVERVVAKEIPVAKYHIQYHPVPGISINCHSGSCVRAVYDGVVSKIFSVDDNENKVVILQHGNYFTVYNGVTQTAVKTGDKITANQEIGTVAANDDGEPSLNFQIWKAGPKKAERTKLDPEVWIIKQY
ncbi:murein hydrolase activator EnvC family protein [Flavipsychrobacter stenotrophus]|nr:M23 family metallopeptidase [Flavipsychrobacter stenotrophus]